MTQKLNLHIGYHKTGTTSLQKHLAVNKTPFYFIGRRYDDSPDSKLVEQAARAVAINDIDEIKSSAKYITKKIKDNGNLNNLISHENFLRPNESAFKGLNLFLSLLDKYFEVNVFISIREINSLILSRFKHDLIKFKKLKPNRYNIPLPILKIILGKSIRIEGECYYPYCNEVEINCFCGNLKKIPLNFYDINYLKKKISYPFLICDLLSKNDKVKDDLVFGAVELFPLPKSNTTTFNTTDRVSAALLKKIESVLKKSKYQ